MNLQDKISNFIQEHRVASLIIAIATLVGFFALAFFGYILYRDYRRSLPGAAWEEVDPVSGVTLLHVNEDPEEPEQTLIILGFQFLFDMGYSSSQYDVIYNVLDEYFTENHPDFTRISYQKDSFHYETATDPNPQGSDEELTLGVATLISDTGARFTLKIDSTFSIKTVKFYLYDADDNLAFYLIPGLYT